nr:adenylate cyclase [Gammaproteobacteria bacterium]
MNASRFPPLRIDGPEIRQIRQRFLLISRSRIERVRQTLTPRQQLFVQLLPLLFHINHPLMPGYVTKDTPSGVSGYAPARTTLLCAAKHVRTFPTVKRAIPAADIYGIYLMGSSGSIGYSARSDLDVWICYRAELSCKQIEQLREKCHGIAVWSCSLGLE